MVMINTKRVFLHAFISFALIAGWQCGQKDPPPGQDAQNITPLPGYARAIRVGQIEFHWKVVGDKMNIHLNAPTQGWVGVGFNPSSGIDMLGANILIGSVNAGKATVEDDSGIGKNRHASDVSHGGKVNVENISGKEENGKTELSFTIPLNSGDKSDTVIDPTKDTLVLLAMGNSDSFLLVHHFRSLSRVNLQTGKARIMSMR